MTELDYELFALRYATRHARRGDHFIGGDPHDGPMPMDYFVWVARGGGRTFVIDTGFNAEVSKNRKRTFLRSPVEALAALGIDANAVEDVILTHLHYDHVGNFDRFPKARFHVQERELTYATGRYMRYPRLSHSFEVEDICGIVRLNYAWRDVLQWRRSTCTYGEATTGRPFGGTSIRPGQDQPRICRAPLRRQSFLPKNG
jgi:glyoxylase-like metal-dependent hydrolase (beta-lactamase superfamily II)